MINNKDTSYITLKDLWEVFIGNIWLFIGSAIVCITVAVGYIAITPPAYQRTASILIKNDDQGKSALGGTQAFESMGLVQSNTDINNEVHVLSTPLLMNEVVERLSLNYNYAYSYKGIRWVDLYNGAPFVVNIDSTLLNTNISFNLTTDGKDSYTIIDLVVNNIELGEDIHGQFGKPLKCGDGSITLERGVYIPSDITDNLYSFSKSDILGAAMGYSSALSVKLRSSDASIIDMSITLESKRKADDILNTLISVYNENWIKDKNLVTLSTTTFINGRLAIIELELGSVDENISKYKSENLLPDMGAVAGINLQSSSDILEKQIELNNQLSMAKYILQYIESSTNNDQLLPRNAGIESESINVQIGDYNELFLKKNTLLTNSSVNNPIVADMISDLNNLKRGLVLSVKDIIITLNIQIRNVQQQELATRKKISNNPTQELYLLSSGREQKIKEELYLFLLQKREENQLSQAFTAYNTKVLNLSSGSNSPIAPQKRVILLFGFVIGLILPLIFLILKSSLDTLIKGKQDIDSLNIPFIGSIPHIETNKKNKKSKTSKHEFAVVTGDTRDILNESFRVVRTNLDFITAGKSDESQVIQLISMNPGSGKSFITVNLGLSMALKDAKVLLIDTDIRKATLSSYLNAPKTGIGEYLGGKNNNIDELILKGHLHENLDVIPVGKIPPNPSELLLKVKFEELIAEMKTRYDYIFLDCPPVDIVPDAAIVGKFCDTSIFVVRAGLLDKRLLPDVEALYESKKYNNMCLLLNDVRYSGKGYYGFRKYGYYGYGYGSENAG